MGRAGPNKCHGCGSGGNLAKVGGCRIAKSPMQTSHMLNGEVSLVQLNPWMSMESGATPTGNIVFNSLLLTNFHI